jgi:hypothetical protein
VIAAEQVVEVECFRLLSTALHGAWSYGRDMIGDEVWIGRSIDTGSIEEHTAYIQVCTYELSRVTFMTGSREQYDMTNRTGQ